MIKQETAVIHIIDHNDTEYKHACYRAIVHIARYNIFSFLVHIFPQSILGSTVVSLSFELLINQWLHAGVAACS